MIITAICGHAIGSSFIIGHNVEKILSKHQYIDTEDIIVELDESLIDYIMFEEV